MNRIRMSAVDAAWLHMDKPENELVVNAVLWFDGPLDDELLAGALHDRLVVRHDRFAQRVEDSGTAAWWVDVPDFDVSAHVTRERLEHSSTLAGVVSRLVSTPLPRDRPLWQVHVVDGYLGGTALVARMHHCIADGVALFRVLLSLSDEAQHESFSPPIGVRPDRPRGMGAALGATARAARAAVGLLLLPPDRRTPLRTPPGPAKCVRWSDPVPLTAVKAHARATNSTVNDVVLAAVSGALCDQLGDAARDVRAVLPVDLRPLDPDAAELGNHFGLVFLTLPVTARPADRVGIVRRRTAALKHSATAPVALGILGLLGRCHRRIVRLAIDVFSTKASLVVTNVPGPQRPLHLGGRRLAGVIAWPPQSGSLGVGISVISYDGVVVVGVMVDEHVRLDPDRLLDASHAELSQPTGV